MVQPGWNFPSKADQILQMGVIKLTTLSVASARARESIRYLLSQEVSVWREKGVSISFSESSTGNLLIFRCEMNKHHEYSAQEVINKIKSSIANGLSNIIVDEYEKILVAKLVDTNYAFLSGADRNYLKSKVLSKLSGKDCFLLLRPERPPGPNQRKSKVWARLAEYLEGENEIVLEGFITFRLKEYLEGIFEIVEETVEDYLTEREYKEFLSLLNTFMKRQKILQRLSTLYGALTTPIAYLTTGLIP